MARLSRPILAPYWLQQSINPWTFLQGASLSLINIDIGRTPRPEVEEEILDEIGTYGRQLGRIGDALEVILRRLKLEDLTRDEEDAIALLRAQLAEVRRVKERHGASRAG